MNSHGTVYQKGQLFSQKHNDVLFFCLSVRAWCSYSTIATYWLFWPFLMLHFFPILFFMNYVEILKMHFGFLFLESESWKGCCWKVERFSKEIVIGWCALPRGSSWKQNQMHHRLVTSCKIKGYLEILPLFFLWTNFALIKVIGYNRTEHQSNNNNNFPWNPSCIKEILSHWMEESNSIYQIIETLSDAAHEQRCNLDQPS